MSLPVSQSPQSPAASASRPAVPLRVVLAVLSTMRLMARPTPSPVSTSRVARSASHMTVAHMRAAMDVTMSVAVRVVAAARW